MKLQAICSALFLLLAATPLRAEKPVALGLGADTVVSPGELKSTPEMWFYDQALRQYKDPKTAVRAKADFRDEQRQRRLAWGEALEHMSPDERMRVNLSARRLATMPPDRQALVKRAFQDLRSVPLDQRQTVLNSARYQSAFTPDERGVLSDLLRVQPYEPPH